MKIHWSCKICPLSEDYVSFTLHNRVVHYFFPSVLFYVYSYVCFICLFLHQTTVSLIFLQLGNGFSPFRFHLKVIISHASVVIMPIKAAHGPKIWAMHLQNFFVGNRSSASMIVVDSSWSTGVQRHSPTNGLDIGHTYSRFKIALLLPIKHIMIYNTDT